MLLRLIGNRECCLLKLLAGQNKLILIEILVCYTIFYDDNYYPYVSVKLLLLLDAIAQVLPV